MKAVQRLSNEEAWSMGRASVEGAAMDAREVKEEGWARFSMDHRSFESGATIWSQREE
jgi:hypothetical protein